MTHNIHVYLVKKKYLGLRSPEWINVHICYAQSNCSNSWATFSRVAESCLTEIMTITRNLSTWNTFTENHNYCEPGKVSRYTWDLTDMVLFLLLYLNKLSYCYNTIFKPNQQDKGKLTGSNFSLKICFLYRNMAWIMLAALALWIREGTNNES